MAEMTNKQAEYWAGRLSDVTNGNIKDAELRIKNYYKHSMKRVIADFEATYDKVLVAVGNDRVPTPADLYNLDKYYQMQAQLRDELNMLGDKESALLSKKFESQYNGIYRLFSNSSFSTVNRADVLNMAWAPDGIHWSKRIWGNTAKLADMLDKELIDCVITGKKTSFLRKRLIEAFGTSYSNVDRLVRTEMAYIQTQASKNAMIEDGVEYYEFFADPDERTCPVCGALDGKRFKTSEMKPGVNATPMHPRCACCVLPVVRE